MSLEQQLADERQKLQTAAGASYNNVECRVCHGGVAAAHDFLQYSNLLYIHIN